VTFEAAEAINIEHHLGAFGGREFAGDRRAAGRKIADLATGFLAIGRREKPTWQLDTHAPEAAAFDPRLCDGGLAFCHCQHPDMHRFLERSALFRGLGSTDGYQMIISAIIRART
jgi:hypothetical protein